MKFLAPLLILGFLLSNCSSGQVAYYAQGDIHSRQFLSHISATQSKSREHYRVKRNAKNQIISAKQLDPAGQLIQKNHYRYADSGSLLRHRQVEYFSKGPPRVSREWRYRNGRLAEKEEKWFTRGRSLEKRITSHYDAEEKLYLSEIWGYARHVESSIEYYYDYNHRLDKSRRNFYLADGSLRDYWLTIYNDYLQIVTEEHYQPNNQLISFYRYAYDPVTGYRESEEILDGDRGIFISRSFDPYGLVLEEIERNREFQQLARRVYEYDSAQRPLRIHNYDADNRHIGSVKYKEARYLEKFRSPDK